MIHEMANVFAWHDLTEDSNDLPTDDKVCLVSIVNKNTNEVYGVEYMYFDHEKKVWVETNDYEGVCYYYMSHGLQPDAKYQLLFYTDEEKLYEVLAWAKKTTIDPYIPQGYTEKG